ncbi:hypothetical protein AOLI_G00101570 [Acnodon oligacanthus]
MPTNQRRIVSSEDNKILVDNRQEAPLEANALVSMKDKALSNIRPPTACKILQDPTFQMSSLGPAVSGQSRKAVVLLARSRAANRAAATE